MQSYVLAAPGDSEKKSTPLQRDYAVPLSLFTDTLPLLVFVKTKRNNYNATDVYSTKSEYRTKMNNCTGLKYPPRVIQFKVLSKAGWKWV